MNDDEFLWNLLNKISIEINKIAEQQGKQSMLGFTDFDLQLHKQQKIEKCEEILEKLLECNTKD